MAETVSHFWTFLVAVCHQYVVLASGGVLTVMIAIIERHWLKRQISYKAEIAVLALFVLFACFGAWDEQYRSNKPTANTPIQVNIPAQPSPQIQVNVPGAGPVVIPSRMAYMAFTSALVANTYKVGGNWVVNGICKNENPSVVAEDVACVAAVYPVDTKRNSFNQLVVNEESQNQMYTIFEKSITTTPPVDRRTYGPLESTFGTVLSPVIDAQSDEAFRNGNKTIIVFGYMNWRDGAGTHTNEACEWLQNEGLFTSSDNHPTQRSKYVAALPET